MKIFITGAQVNYKNKTKKKKYSSCHSFSNLIMYIDFFIVRYTNRLLVYLLHMSHVLGLYPLLHFLHKFLSFKKGC